MNSPDDPAAPDMEDTASKNTAVPAWVEILWDEYKYRHSHVWKTVYRLTAASIAIAAIPYTKPDLILPLLGRAVFVFPVGAILLLAFGAIRIRREMATFDQVKNEYRSWQKSAPLCFKFPNNRKLDGIDPSGFKMHVYAYLFTLLLLAVGNLWAFSNYSPESGDIGNDVSDEVISDTDE